MKKVLMFFWQWLIAIPILLVCTIFTACFTVVTVRWKNSEFVHKVQQWWSKMFFWMVFTHVDVEGAENLEKGKSYVFVANHTSFFDTWIIYGCLPVVFKWMMKAELRKVPFIGTGCAAAGHIFVDRKHPKAAAAAVEKAKKALVDGVSLVVFPEGTRSTDGKVHEFKRGAFQIAFDLGLPVVPLSLNGPLGIMPRGSALVNPGVRCKLVIGKPVDIQPYLVDDDAEPQVRRAKQQEVMDLLREKIIEGLK